LFSPPDWDDLALLRRKFKKNENFMRRISILPLLLCVSLTACNGDHLAKTKDHAPAAPIIQLRAETPSTGKVVLPPTQISDEGKLLRLDYEGFTVWLDCEQRGAVKWRYNAQRDGGNEARANDFRLDPYVPKECQQTSPKGYGHVYDRGHQVPANHLDHSPVAIQQSNYMSNILPQASQMNRGGMEADRGHRRVLPGYR
jgi:endonuclease G